MNHRLGMFCAGITVAATIHEFSPGHEASAGWVLFCAVLTVLNLIHGLRDD